MQVSENKKLTEEVKKELWEKVYADARSAGESRARARELADRAKLTLERILLRPVKEEKVSTPSR